MILSLEHIVMHAFHYTLDAYSVILKSFVPFYNAAYTLCINYFSRDCLRASYNGCYRLISAYTPLLFIEVLSLGPIEASSIIQRDSCCRQKQIKSLSCSQATTAPVRFLTAKASSRELRRWLETGMWS